MANKLKQVTGRVGTADEIFHTVLTGSTYTIVGLHVTNITDSSIVVDITCNDFFYGKGVIIPAGGGYEFIEAGSKWVLNSEDAIKVLSSVDESADVFISFLEQTEGTSAGSAV